MNEPTRVAVPDAETCYAYVSTAGGGRSCDLKSRPFRGTGTDDARRRVKYIRPALEVSGVLVLRFSHGRFDILLSGLLEQ